MKNISTETNIEEVTITKQQAHFFAIQLFSEIKNYIADHKAEFAAWCVEQEEKINEQE